jgi:acyl-CoA thioesterase
MDAPELFTGPHQFEMDGWITCAPFERLLNITIKEAVDGRATLTMPFLRDYAQGAGLMHGGAIATLADTAVVMAIKSIITPGSHFATTAMQMRYLHPIKQGMITAYAHVAPSGDRLIEGRTEVCDHKNRVAAEFTSTFKLARDTRIEAIKFPESRPE